MAGSQHSSGGCCRALEERPRSGLGSSAARRASPTRCSKMDLPSILPRIRADREVVLAAVQQCAWALQYATEALREDREVVLSAALQNAGALRFAADGLLEDPTFATAVKR
eukprot:4315433-Amphidinium_carterae.1